MTAEEGEQELLAVFAHYDLPEPRHGDHPMKCPVHDDRVASASVNRDKGVWHCHACGAGGTAVNLVMAREGIAYGEAADKVRSMAGTTRRSPSRPSPVRRSGKRWVPPSLRRSA